MRLDVLGQNRGADPPPEAGRIRPPAGRNLQTPHRRAILRRGGRFARCQRDPLHAGRFGTEYPADDLGRDVVGIDEAQFFDQGLVEVCRQLADSGVRVIVAGLDMDFTGKPFGPMPALMATAEYVTKVHAICVRCGNLAHHSHRLTNDEKQVMLGAQDSYEPICRHCFAELRKKERE